MDLIIIILPVDTKDLPISPRFMPCDFLSRCKVSTLTTRHLMVEFYLLTFPHFPFRNKDTNHTLVRKNRTHDFRTIKQVCRLPTRPLGRQICMYENKYQVYVALFKLVISMKDFRITIYID